MPEHCFDVSITPTTSSTVQEAVILATDHDTVDYAKIRTYAELIIDERGVWRESALNVVRPKGPT